MQIIQRAADHLFNESPQTFRKLLSVKQNEANLEKELESTFKAESAQYPE
jgi:hypothetical protein